MLRYSVPVFGATTDQQHNDALEYIYQEARLQKRIAFYSPDDITRDTPQYRYLPRFLHQIGTNVYETAIIHTVSYDVKARVLLHGTLTGLSYPKEVTTPLFNQPLQNILLLANYLNTIYHFRHMQRSRKQYSYEVIVLENTDTFHYKETKDEQVLHVYEHPHDIYIVEVLKQDFGNNQPVYVIDQHDTPSLFKTLEAAEEFVFEQHADKLVKDYIKPVTE